MLERFLAKPKSRALYLFPTKALAQDQLAALANLNVSKSQSANIPAAIYDGDTQQRDRAAIRKNARVVLSNPDMLHTGILPHHTNWADFFRKLHFVVIDEMHTYRGVFGSHIANVIRRLKRVGLGPLSDQGLKIGRFRKLLPHEVRALERIEQAPPPRSRPYAAGHGARPRPGGAVYGARPRPAAHGPRPSGRREVPGRPRGKKRPPRRREE